MKTYDFSVVIPVLNGEPFISKCISSLIRQRESGIKLQIIVVDGGSTDRTLQILQNYSKAIDILISEKGLNQTRSIKKGFELAEGKYLAWINADDMYNDNTLFKIKKTFESKEGISFVYGNCVYVNEQDEILKVNRTHSRLLAYLLNYTDFMLSQESCFWTKKSYIESGGLDPKVDYAMDYELFCKLIKKGFTHYIDENLATCLVHKKQRHREKLGEFTFWNIERARIQSRNNRRQRIGIRYFIVTIFMAYKNIVVERKLSLDLSRINSVALFRPFSTVSIIKRKTE
jgi:glycosyltransferase involved in cell wall biosynthesis